MNYLAKNLKFLIRKFDTSQSQLALYVNKRQQSISNWINGISDPEVSDLILIHQFFGISVDGLIFQDLENGKIVTDEHIADFKRNGKVSGKVSGKVLPVSKDYFSRIGGQEMTLNEPDSLAHWTYMGQFKQLSEKLDQLRVTVDSIAKKGP